MKPILDFGVFQRIKDLYQFAFKIEVIEKSGGVTSPHPARFGRARRARGQALGAGGGCQALGARRSAILK
jgi:hypothetical protein